ncbi:MAG: hypothetical protein ACK401_05585 [Archaeoglobaceae archaeon]
MKPLSEFLEVHVRGYEDNTLDAEIELSREFLKHLDYEAKPYYGFLISILRRYKVPFKTLAPIPPDPDHIVVPKTLTEWKPLLAITCLSIVVLALIIGDRRKMC